MSSGFPRVRETCRRIGLEFDPWQSDLNRCVLGKTSDGLFAAAMVALSICRQAGKTFDIGAVVFAECIAEPGTTVVWTAHQFKVARETFDSLRALAKSPKLAPHLDYDAITTAAGNECIPFRNGSRIVFAARERGAVRGFSKVRILILDEAQILTERALADLAPTMNQAVNPLIILMGTPPRPNDPSEAFARLRVEALSGDSDDVMFVEFSADPGSEHHDREAWRKANPSYPKRTPARAILRLQKLLAPEDFSRECLGIWDADRPSSSLATAWADCADKSGQIDGNVVFCIDVALDRARASLGVVGKRADGRFQGELVVHDFGTAWLVDAAKTAALEWGAPVALDQSGPGSSLQPELEAAGVEVIALPRGEVVQACGFMLDTVKEHQFAHLDDPSLNAAVNGARLKTGESFVFTRKGDVDISPLYAVTLALWVCSTRATGPSTYESNELLVL